MIVYKTGNLLDSSCECLVNTVNVVGVMGKGIAKDFKQKYPALFEPYKVECWSNHFHPGEVFVWRDTVTKKWIFNLATKNHWRDPSLYDWIWCGIYNLHAQMLYKNTHSIAVPPIGCGNGGLNKAVVKQMLELFGKTFWLKYTVELYGF